MRITRPWTPEEDAELKRRWEAHEHSADIAAALDRSAASITNRRNVLRVYRPTPERRAASTVSEPPRDPVDVERERQAKLKALRDEREALKDVAGERSLRAMLEGMFRDIAPTFNAPPPYREPKRLKGTTSETLLLQISDWHYGEEVDAEGTRGFNSYNTAIATTRARAVVRSVLAIADKMRAGRGWSFPRLVVALNGDMITGTIHELERHSDPKNVVWSAHSCGMLLAECLRDLAAAFPRVDVFATSGNHGRLPDARRVQSKDPTRNWDTVVALFAQAALRDVPSISITIPHSYAVGYDVEGMTVLQSHGHEIKSWSGIPWYGINRFLGNYNALEASRGGKIGAYLFAHFHSQTNITYPGGEAFVNGSLIGGTEWTIGTLGKSDRPSQTLLGIHAAHGITHRWPIYADTEGRI